MAKATRMAFICKDNKLYFKYYTFEYFSGFAITQKRKSIESFHNAIKKDNIFNILEVSRKSENELGNMLSAFNLKINNYPVECIYQSSKVFGDTQYKECLSMLPADAKKYIREKVEANKFSLTGFTYNNFNFPLEPKSLFYDYLYIKALYGNVELSKQIINFDCFTDIEFNHQHQFASQARSCALYKYLKTNSLVEKFLQNPLDFKDLYLDLQENSLF